MVGAEPVAYKFHAGSALLREEDQKMSPSRAPWDAGQTAGGASAVRISGVTAVGLFNGLLLSMLVWLPVLMWFWSSLLQRGLG